MTKNQFARRAFGLLLISMTVFYQGCGPEKKPEEVSAAKSGFKPADVEKKTAGLEKTTSDLNAATGRGSSETAAPINSQGTTAANNPKSGSSIAASSPPKSSSPTAPATTVKTPPSDVAVAPVADSTTKKSYPTELASPPNQLGATGELKPAPELPTFDPTKIDPSIAGKSYIKLALTETQDPKELIRFILSTDRSLQELLTDNARRLVPQELMVDRGMALSRMKLSASERLAKIAQTADEKGEAAKGKLEALFQMSQFKDATASDELRTIAKELSQNEDSRVAIHARRIKLVIATNDFDRKEGTADAIVEAAKELLSDLPNPDGPTFLVAGQSAMMLGSGEETEAACDQVVDLLEKAYRNATNIELGMKSWQLKLERFKDFDEIAQILDSRLAAGAKSEDIVAAAQKLMERVPSPWTAFALSRAATQFEHVGRRDIAKTIFDIAETQLPNAKCDEVRDNVKRAIDGFNVRATVVGKPFPLTDLVDTAGTPLNVDSLKGKVVLIDFWATWCAPCIAEMPKLKKLYEEKHDSGFELVSINVDDERTNVGLLLSQRPMPWKTYWSSNTAKQGMNTNAAEAVGLNAIPFTLLIDRDGNVVAMHLLGAELEKKVAELLDQSPKVSE